jgi:hypothetical protein
MRAALLAATAILCGAAGYSALAQVPNISPFLSGARPGHEVGVGDSLPRSNKASNIGAADTRTAIAPTLPPANVGENDGVSDYLRAARSSLAAGKTGEAQQELEMAETRVLDRSVAADQAATPSNSPLAARIREAREDLGNGDTQGAMEMIDRALAG